ncbi:MAG TPA: hypothetical protein VGO93_14595 [Candidatus Xenobia bacterium]
MMGATSVDGTGSTGTAQIASPFITITDDSAPEIDARSAAIPVALVGGGLVVLGADRRKKSAPGG